jgi:hypothetical protein
MLVFAALVIVAPAGCRRKLKEVPVNVDAPRRDNAHDFGVLHPNETASHVFLIRNHSDGRDPSGSHRAVGIAAV